MKRRDFLKLSLLAGGNLIIPGAIRAADQSVLDQVRFDRNIYNANRPRTIMVFLYGGASELAGNFTNYDSFKGLSQSSYEAYFGSGNLTATANGFWQAAGGPVMEELLTSGDLHVLRTCYSRVRDIENNRSHGPCVAQNQRGSVNENTSGIFATLGHILKAQNIVNERSVMPFLSMEGNSGFFAEGETWLDTFLRPLSIDENLHNSYRRNNLPHQPGYSEAMDILAQKVNRAGKIKDAFQRRAELEMFISEAIDNSLREDLYPDSSFANRLKTAINIMTQNPDTQVISTGSGGLGGWDDHSDAEQYLSRMNNLFAALRAAMEHLRLDDPGGHINIIVMGEFGRGVNLNSANGWDHGNLQTLFVLGGKRYFKPAGLVGQTVVEDKGSVNRLFLKPAPGSYWFEPMAVASTIYRIYGVTNPQILTDNTSPVTALV